MLGKYKRWNNILKIIENEYYDTMLSQDNSYSVSSSGNSDNGLIAYIDCSVSECISDNKLKSFNHYIWENAVNEGVTIFDIGLTGIDNGFIKFDKDTITKEEFKNILTGTSFVTEKGDMYLTLYPITGNTKAYTYPLYYNNIGFYEMKGGFFQGAFKFFNENYQVLPLYPENAFTLEFFLRPKEYTIANTVLNSKYPENSGIFFYIGTRAENKFAEFYKGNAERDEKEIILTSEGDDVTKNNTYKVETDNKYLFFNRTKDGFNTDTWDDCDTVELSGKKTTVKKTVEVKSCRENKIITTDNKYLFMNRTKTGYTTDDIREENDDTMVPYNESKDLRNNAFALRITEEGEVEYRYAIFDCESGMTIISEHTNLSEKIKKDEWATISVVFKILDGSLNECELPTGERNMRIYIYVNGYLKLVSRVLPEIRLHELNDFKEKQEMVPFNLSIGGGTQGLGESIWLDYQKIFTPGKFLEKNFAGTFIGDFALFKFYDRPLEYDEIRNNSIINKKRYD